MSDEQLSDELRGLFRGERERAREPVPDAARHVLEDRLAPLLIGVAAGGALSSGGGAGASAGTASTATTLGLKALAIFAAGAALGTTATIVLRPPRVEVRTVEVERRVEVPARSVAPSTSGPPAPSAASSSPPHVAVRSTAGGSLTDDRALARERVLLEAARSALSRRDAAAALEATDTHSKEFSRGRLVEEREALAIQALVLAGRDGEARSRAARFHKRFPDGLFLPVVDAAIDSLPSRE
jgi:hypothetical protein